MQKYTEISKRVNDPVFEVTKLAEKMRKWKDMAGFNRNQATNL